MSSELAPDMLLRRAEAMAEQRDWQGALTIFSGVVALGRAGSLGIKLPCERVSIARTMGEARTLSILADRPVLLAQPRAPVLGAVRVGLAEHDRVGVVD